MPVHGEHAGATRVRRERKKQMAIQMVLASVQHHSHGVLRNQRTATRTGGEARDVVHGQVPEVAGWQSRGSRHTVDQIVDAVPATCCGTSFRACACYPVPQMVDQLPDIEQFFRALSPDPEQFIEVPKILPFDVYRRAAVRVPQLAEQLLEVPTIISYSSLLRTVEQHVDIPVPGRGEGISGLQDFFLWTEFNSVAFQETHF